MLASLPKPQSPHAFAGSPLDRADRLRGDDEAMAKLLKDATSRFVCFWKLKPLFTVGETARIHWVGPETVGDLVDLGTTWVFLGLGDGAAHFALDISGLDEPESDGPFAGMGTFVDLLRSAGALDQTEAGILAHGRSLIDWHARHRFCAVCGTETEVRQSGTSRECPSEGCKAQHFPRTDPVVIMLPIFENTCLLGRQAFFPKHMYSALAGFVEPGEALEEAVRREVDEEAGIAVGRVFYHSSQPWPFPSSLMMGCHCEAVSQTIDCSSDELEEARWFEKDMVREALAGKRKDELWMPPPFAIAHQLIKSWVSAED